MNYFVAQYNNKRKTQKNTPKYGENVVCLLCWSHHLFMIQKKEHHCQKKETTICVKKKNYFSPFLCCKIPQKDTIFFLYFLVIQSIWIRKVVTLTRYPVDYVFFFIFFCKRNNLMDYKSNLNPNCIF